MLLTIRLIGLLAAFFVLFVNCGPTQKTSYNIFTRNLNKPEWKDTLISIRNDFMAGGSDHSLTGKRIKRDDPEMNPVVCSICESAVEQVLELYRLGYPNAVISDAVIGMCEAFDLAPSHICRGMVDLYLPIAIYIISNNSDLTQYTVCGTVFEADRCHIDDAGIELMDWRIQIDESNSRPANESKRTIIQTDREPLTIVHITDTHTDPLYAVGSLADCDEPLCCREGVLGGKPIYPNQTAGRWGDYRLCDSPWEATINVFEQIKNNHAKIDIVYFTGDIIDHAIWRTSATANAAAITKTSQTLREIFPNTQVYPIIGNHDPHPSDMFAPSTVTDSELESRSMYAMLAENWQQWLPADALTTVIQSGYYSTLVRPGFRVIGLNNNEGATVNYWILLDPSYASRQLQWLHDTLLQAERDGEKVHILVHFPNNHGTMHTVYSREYGRIVERFWDTISGQFNGHTHRDQFYVFYDRETSSKAINVAWNGGSATAWTHVNPNYRVYTVEPETFHIINHQTWIYNLTEANQNANDTPRWFQEYSFAEEFGISDLSPDSLDSLLTRFSQDEQALHRYWQFTVKQGDPWLLTGCDKYCLAAELCSMATTVFTPGIRNGRCEELLDKWIKTA